MPTPTIILRNAPISVVLASNEVAKGTLFGQRLDPSLPEKIYAIYIPIKKIFDIDPNYSGMVAVCNYLWELMGRYGIAAMAYTGGGGEIAPPTSDGYYTYRELSISVDGNSGSPIAGEYTYQNDDLILGKDLSFIIVNNNTESVLYGDFTINFITGTITRQNQWQTGDVCTIPFNQKITL
jgi:hypothetical protein